MTKHTHIQVDAKSPSAPIPAMQPNHSGWLPQQEQEDPDRSLFPASDWLRSPSPSSPSQPPSPPPINPSAGHRFGSMAIGPTTPPVLQLLPLANSIAQRQEEPQTEEDKEEEPIQAKAISPSLVPSLQRQTNPEGEEKQEEEVVQTKVRPEQGVTGFVQRYRQRVTQTEVSRPPGVPILQRKLVIGQPNDKYEQEADRVADQVMRMPEPNPVGQQIVNPMRATLVQRMCSACEEEELQPKPLASQITPLVQRQAESPENEEETVQTKPMSDLGMSVIQKQETEPEEEEEETVQPKSVNYQDSSLVQRQGEEGEEEEEETVQAEPIVGSDRSVIQKQRIEGQEEEEEPLQTKENPGQVPSVSSTLEARLNASKGSGQPLPEQTRTFMESRFGQDFSRVRIHAGSEATQLNRELKAQAFTHRQDIYFGAGKYGPETGDGKRLLAHELVHVVQQTSRIQQKLTVGQPSVQQSLAQSGAFGIHAIGSQAQHGLLQCTPAEAEALISRHTSWGNLDETLFGRELLRLALDGQLTLADEVLNALGSTDRDDVAYEFMLVATDPQLVRLAASAASRQFLHRIFDELTSGSVADEEQQQADRILQVTARQTVSVGAFEAAATSRRTKIFPFRLPGFTVLDDAPIEARRERGGVWVHSYVRVAGTAMFRAETATLPTEYFLSGIVLPETEVIGVRLYDQGGIIHYTTPLFLIQLANATDQRVLEKILEAAGIGLTLGSGALAGLGIEASMAARVLLWADRAAFALGTVTSVLREHRSWLVEQFGPGFMDAVDIIHSATAIYGLARVALQAPRIIQGLRNSYRAFRETARSRSSGFSSSEQTTIQQVTQSTDELIDQIDNIQGARRTPQTGPQQAAEPAPLGESAGGRPQAQPAPPTVAEPAPPTAAEPAAPRTRIRPLPSSCFVAGTKVITPNGSKEIESITTSDFVLSIDPSSGEKVIQKISSKFIATASDIFDIKIGKTLITCSSKHPFWVIGKGWKEAKTLEVGEDLLSISGSTARIDSIQAQRGSLKVFNLEVEGIHTYCVSDLGILVHNKGAVNYSEFARQLGYTRRIPPQRAPFNSHGQPVFSNGRTYITADVDSHIGGVWKMFNRRGQRLGTYDANLNRIGD